MKANTTAEDVALVEKHFPALKGKIVEPHITTLAIARQREAEAGTCLSDVSP